MYCLCELYVKVECILKYLQYIPKEKCNNLIALELVYFLYKYELSKKKKNVQKSNRLFLTNTNSIS